MEGVGARLGRTSTRYGPPTVFTGPVRKWKKKWIPISPSTKKENTSSASTAVTNGNSASNGSNESHLLLFKWSPLSQSSNGNGNDDVKSESNSPSEEPVDTAAAVEDPPRRRFKYIPIAVLEEQKRELMEIEEEEEDDDKVEEDDDDDDKEVEEGDTEDTTNAAEPIEKKSEVDEKLDVPMEDKKEEEKIVRQDLNGSTLGLNLNANDSEAENDLKEDDK